MSLWTYVNGVVEIDCTDESQSLIETKIKNVLKDLPVVRGSERDMEVHIIQHNGKNFFTTDSDNIPIELQTRYSLVLVGDLRDSILEDTNKLFNEWLNELSKKLFIDSVLVSITDHENQILINIPHYKCNL